MSIGGRYPRYLQVGLGARPNAEYIPDMSDDAFRHILAFDLELTVGILIYLTQDVLNPPPEMLFSDPVLYDLDRFLPIRIHRRKC